MSISPYPEKHQASSCEDAGNGGQQAENRVRTTDVSAKLAPEAAPGSSDERELLVNDQRKGTASLIATTVDEVASIHGFLIDLDCKLLAAKVVGEECTKNSTELFEKHVIHWLARDPVLEKAQVRATSKLGLHVLLYLDRPLLCGADQSRWWDKVAKCFRCILPGDPKVNGIVAMTRPVNAQNTKYSPSHTVRMLREGSTVSVAEILDLAQKLANKPAPTLMQVLYGGRRIAPCPLCSNEGSSLGVAGNWQAQCYECGRTFADKLMYRFYKSYWINSQKESLNDNLNPNEPEAGLYGQPLAWMNAALKEGLKAMCVLESGRVPAVRVRGVTSSGQFTGDAEQVLGTIVSALNTSGRLFRQGNTLIFLHGGNESSAACRPAVIAVDGEATKTASALISNVIMCATKKANSLGKDANVDQPPEYDQTFEVPPKILQQVVVSDGFMDSIAKADIILDHPVFDNNYQWLGAGYHESQRILICGRSCEPAAIMPGDTEGSEQAMSIDEVIERLPPTIRGWVSGFNWAAAVDLINYIGSAMMIPLMPILVEDGHPGVIFWGNKPGIGKSLAAQCLAILKDGRKASPTSPDGGTREIENQILSELNDGRTVLFLDNQKGNLNVSTLEANMTTSELAFRAFHVQRKVRRPNVVLWLITTNDGMPSDDFLSRCVHVRLHYEGVAEKKCFTWTERELHKYVETNRLNILAELGGMIQLWLDAGRPRRNATCRFRNYGAVVGSVLSHWGLKGFLSNTRDEFQENSEKHQQLVALAGRLIDSRDGSFVREVDGEIERAADQFESGPRPVNPREQKDWVNYLLDAGVITPACSKPESQKTLATRYLKSVLKVPVEVDIGEVTVEAMIVSRSLGKRRTAYALAVKGLSAIAGVEQASDAEMDLLAPDAADDNPASDRELPASTPALDQSSDWAIPSDQPGEVPGAQPDGNELEYDLWSEAAG